MKKFIEGTLEIKDDISNLDDFVALHRKEADYIISYANENDIELDIGTSINNEILCKYKIIKESLKECRQTMSELRRVLRILFKKIDLLYEAHGSQLI